MKGSRLPERTGNMPGPSATMEWTSRSWRSRRRLTASRPARHSPSPWRRRWTTGFTSDAVVSEKDAAGWKRLVAVARGIDPEPLRDRLRSTWGRPVSEAQDELRRLAESIDVRAQHPATLASLGMHPRGELSIRDAALRLLRDAQYVYPGDFWLNFELGLALAARGRRRGDSVLHRGRVHSSEFGRWPVQQPRRAP